MPQCSFNLLSMVPVHLARVTLASPHQLQDGGTYRSIIRKMGERPPSVGKEGQEASNSNFALFTRLVPTG